MAFHWIMLAISVAFLPCTFGVTGVDVSTAVSESAWKCLQSPGGEGPVAFGVARVYTEAGHVDTTGLNTIKAANVAGVKHVDGEVSSSPHNSYELVVRRLFISASGVGSCRAGLNHRQCTTPSWSSLWYDLARYRGLLVVAVFSQFKPSFHKGISRRMHLAWHSLWNLRIHQFLDPDRRARLGLS